MNDPGLLISVDELRPHLADAAWVVVDCRFNLLQPEKGRAEYRAGHIPRAVFADLDRDLAAPVTDTSGRHQLPEAESLAATLGRLGIGNDTRVVVYDYGSGALAARLWWMLRWLGHSRVAVLDGGFAAWRAAGGEVETELPQASVQRFRPRPDERMLIGTEELQKALSGDHPPPLVDARDRQRFLGEIEPIDTVAGHIPGALNFPFADSLNPDGRWRETAQLREQWVALFANELPADWIAMCGSGVTACHLAISAERAGLPAPRLYVGSWSEWIRDPQREVATGG